MEELDPQFKKAFEREASWKELTVASLQLTSREAVVFTNSGIYFLRRRLFSVVCQFVPLVKIIRLEMEDSSLVCLHGNSQKPESLEFDKKKEKDVKLFIKKVYDRLDNKTVFSYKKR